MNRVRLNSQIRKAFQGRSRGFALIDILIAIALFGIISIAFLSTLSTASTILIIADDLATAESLARSQMEYVKNQDKSASYEPTIPDAYGDAGYSANITTNLLNEGLQKITIKIYRHDEELVTLVGYKVF
ncbi:MAG: type II secretion system protein [Chloroflexi bacterium]|nr:type II secretion system protein [Chloroflexota bacterium]